MTDYTKLFTPPRTEFTGDPERFQNRPCNEFVTFLLYVRRFLYGEGRMRRRAGSQDDDPGASPMRVFRRDDIKAVRIVSRLGDAPITFNHCPYRSLLFFDINVRIRI